MSKLYKTVIFIIILHAKYFAKSENECGVNVGVSHLRSQRIIAGYRSLENSSPWMGMIVRSSEGDLVCGCTLIDSKWVLTAAHCFQNSFNTTLLDENEIRESFIIKLGKFKLKPRMNDLNIKIKSVHIHPNFKRIDRSLNGIIFNQHDIALIQLSHSIPYSPIIRPACLPSFNNLNLTNNASFGRVSGWGRIHLNHQDKAIFLQEAMLPMVDKVTCQLNSQFVITDNMLCAGYAMNYEPDTCQGDSGGPLLVRNGVDHSWYIVGIISYGESCSSSSYGIYTRVDKYIQWIRNTTQAFL